MAGPMNRKQTVGTRQALKSLSSGNMRRIIKLVFEHYGLAMIVVFFGIIGSSVATVRGTLFIRTLIDDYVVPLTKTQNPNFGPLFSAMSMVALIYTFGALCSYVYNRIMVYVGQGTMLRIRKNLFNHMESLPINYFDTHSHGDIMSIYTNDTDTLRQFIGMSFPQLINSVVTVISIFISMCMLNLELTALSVAMIVVILFISGKVAKLSGRYFGMQQKNLGSINGYIEEMISGQKVVKVFGHERKALDDFKKLNENLRESADKANSWANILMPTVAQLGNVSYVLCALVGSGLAVTGYNGFTIGTIVAFLTLNKSFNQPFMQMSQQLNTVVMASAGANRIYELMDVESEKDDGYVTLVNAHINNEGTITECKERTGIWAWRHYHKDTDITTYIKLEGDIEMKDVDFSYVPDKMVLKSINLYANQGQKVAFVGSTGAGKTTITNLINRFYDISYGKIHYDGININKIRKSDLRRSLGVVLQDTHLFSGTVMENIRYGRLDATDEECRSAAKLANADGFIERLPNSYDSYLTGDGSSLSQGQRQLIAIARAAIADPPVLILDEATSSIDTRTEQLIQHGMDSLMKGRTSFVIAHRLSTVRNADCIIVLDKGHIIERGSHDELIKEEGRYYQLYTGNLSET